MTPHESSHRQLTRNQRSYPPTPWWWSVPLVVASFAVLLAVLVAGILRRAPWPTMTWRHPTVPLKANRRRTRSSRAAPSRSARESSSRTFPDDVPVFPSANDIYFVTISEPTQSLLSWVIGGDEPVIHWLTEFEKQRQPDAEPASGAVAADDGNVRRRGQVRRPQGGWIRPEDRAAGPRGGFAGSPVAPVDDKCPQPAPWRSCSCPATSSSRRTARTSCPRPTSARHSRTRSRATPSGITVRRGEKDVTGDIELVADPDDPSRAIVGFVPFGRSTSSFRSTSTSTWAASRPVGRRRVHRHAARRAHEGRPAHGDVAMTGTIALDGTIGAIGGLPQKAEAVRRPESTCSSCRKTRQMRNRRRADRRGRSRHRSGGQSRRSADGARRARRRSPRPR